MQIPFCGPTYNGRSLNIDASRCVNFYPELTNAPDGKSQIVLVGTPGLGLFALGIGGQYTPVRGMHSFNNTLYAVIGSKFYSVAVNGVATLIASTLSTSAGRISFTNNGTSSHGVGGDQILFVDGVDGYIWNTKTTIFTKLPSTAGWADLKTGGTPQQVEFLDGYFIAINGSMNYYVSDLYDGTTWRAIATSGVTSNSDTIQAVVNHRQQLMFLNDWSTEVHYDTATPTTQGSPFSRSPGAVFDYGVAAKWSVAKGATSFFFLCTQRTADGGELVGVAEVVDYMPNIISPPAINYRISTSTTVANCFGYCYIEQGHVFYVLTNPDDNWTLVYDMATKMWHERSSLETTSLQVGRHLGNCYTYCYGKHFVGDYRNSNIYEMSSSYLNDNGVPITSFRTAQTISDPTDRKRMFISELIIDAETGSQPNASVGVAVTPYPAGWSGSANVLILADGSITAGAVMPTSSASLVSAYLSWSDDAGHTWSAEYPCSMGLEGVFTSRLVWRRLGFARDRVFKLALYGICVKNIISACDKIGI